MVINDLKKTLVTIESQNADVRRSLWKLPGPIPLLKLGHPERIALVHAQMALEYLLRAGKLSGQPVPGFSHSK